MCRHPPSSGSRPLDYPSRPPLRSGRRPSDLPPPVDPKLGSPKRGRCHLQHLSTRPFRLASSLISTSNPSDRLMGFSRWKTNSPVASRPLAWAWWEGLLEGKCLWCRLLCRPRERRLNIVMELPRTCLPLGRLSYRLLIHGWVNSEHVNLAKGKRHTINTLSLVLR